MSDVAIVAAILLAADRIRETVYMSAADGDGYRTYTEMTHDDAITEAREIIGKTTPPLWVKIEGSPETAPAVDIR